MAQQTRLGCSGIPRQTYLGFIAKAEAGAGVHTPDRLTRIGASGIPRKVYADFIAKAEEGVVQLPAPIPNHCNTPYITIGPTTTGSGVISDSAVAGSIVASMTIAGAMTMTDTVAGAITTQGSVDGSRDVTACSPIYRETTAGDLRISTDQNERVIQ